MFGRMRTDLQRELASIREAGLFKEERQILTPQAPDIRVAYPAGSPPREVINFCANNYLGLSSHPKVLAAAREALDRLTQEVNEVQEEHSRLQTARAQLDAARRQQADLQSRLGQAQTELGHLQAERAQSQSSLDALQELLASRDQIEADFSAWQEARQQEKDLADRSREQVGRAVGASARAVLRRVAGTGRVATGGARALDRAVDVAAGGERSVGGPLVAGLGEPAFDDAVAAERGEGDVDEVPIARLSARGIARVDADVAERDRAVASR